MNIPRIYAYSDERFPDCLKVGYTTRTAEERVREQTEAVKMPQQTWRIELDELAMTAPSLPTTKFIVACNVWR